MPYSGNEIIEATGGVLIRGSADQVFVAVSTDTREPQAGKLFIPLQGPRFDGHSFLAGALKNGATGLIIREGEEGRLKELIKDVTVIRVPDTLSALGAVARFWRKKFHIPVMAITGSAGKTTTKEMTALIMGYIKNTLKTEGNFNNLVGLPLTILRLSAKHELAILEMGTNVPGEIGRLCRIAAPDIGLITNIGSAHLEGLKSLDVIREEKGALFRSLPDQGTAVINVDDEAIRALAGRFSGNRVTYGRERDADVSAEEVAIRERGMSFILRIGSSRGKVDLAAVGNHNVMNALAAAATAWTMGADQEIIRRGLGEFKPIPARMETISLKNGAFLIDDTYNANPVSVREALMSLRSLQGKHQSAVILGDMLELGERAEELHAEIGGIIAAAGIDALFLKGSFSWATAAGALKNGMAVSRIFITDAPEEIMGKLSSFLQEGDWVLVKGSRAMKMEEVVESIKGTFGQAEGSPELSKNRR
jgi:UDP-N-acetylmuramoyl-tripeptide--D-alanyl-D-alanine ligase